MPRVPYLGGNPATAYALEIAKNRLFARSSRKKTLVVITSDKKVDRDKVLRPIKGNGLCKT